jgi:A/G-specific adenine glycosylase
MNDTAFKRLIRTHWRNHGRHDLPWRLTTDPYAILVSEVMLQQTQVSRVVDKHREFLMVFPTFRALARAPVSRVLKVWQGLGYNRRALQLHRCAQVVVREHKGKLPAEYETLRKLPGIGPYTAGAVLAFAFNAPHPVIETNIRRVYLHHYFSGRRKVADSTLLKVVERTLDRKNPRIWYSALMDYGTHLATAVPNPNRRSRSYTRQPTFEGSLRQLRGRILRHLTKHGAISHPELASLMQDKRTGVAIAALEREGFVRVAEALVHLVS